MIHLWDIFINTPQFLLGTISISLLIKGVLLGILSPQRLRAATIKQPLLLLIGVILGSMVGELAWGVKLIRMLFIPSIPYAFVIFCVRIAWAFLIMQYVALGLFLESLTKRTFTLSKMQQLCIIISGALILYYLYLAFFNGALVNEDERIIALSTASSISP